MKFTNKIRLLMVAMGITIAYAADGSLNSSVMSPETIVKAGSHTAVENAMHQTYCSELGGVDITDNSDIHMGPNTVDAIFCKITDKNKFLHSIQYAMVGTTNQDGEPQLSNEADSDIISQLSKIGVGGTYWAQAADGTVRMYQLWYCTGTGHYDDVEAQSSIEEQVPAFGCDASNSAYEGDGPAILTATVTCRASQGTPWTYDYATACVDGSGCVQDRGIINFTR